MRHHTSDPEHDQFHDHPRPRQAFGVGEAFVHEQVERVHRDISRRQPGKIDRQRGRSARQGCLVTQVRGPAKCSVFALPHELSPEDSSVAMLRANERSLGLDDCGLA
jgi:hypothetical protein